MNNALTTTGSTLVIPAMTRLTDTNAALIRSSGTAVTHENGRAALAYTALENTMLLSALEAHCYRIAPFGERRYAQIVDAYAVSAVGRLMQW